MSRTNTEKLETYHNVLRPLSTVYIEGGCMEFIVCFFMTAFLKISAVAIYIYYNKNKILFQSKHIAKDYLDNTTWVDNE